MDRKLGGLILVCTLVLSLSYCSANRFAIVQAGGHKLSPTKAYRLDRWTGSVALISGERMAPVIPGIKNKNGEWEPIPR